MTSTSESCRADKMTETFLKAISGKYSSKKIDKCKDKKCCIRLDVKTGHVILRGEKVESIETVDGTRKKMCDCIIFQSDRRILLVELKHKIYHVDDVYEQFCNAIKRSIQIASEVAEGAFIMHLVLLHKGHIANSTVELLARKIRLGGTEYAIDRHVCGASLSDVLDRNIFTRIRLSR